eukprot:12929345-Prorocentrum_lima.AAC.1
MSGEPAKADVAKASCGSAGEGGAAKPVGGRVVEPTGTGEVGDISEGGGWQTSGVVGAAGADMPAKRI